MEKKSWFAWWIFAASCIISLVGFGLIINTVGLFYEPVSTAFHVERASVAFMSTCQNIAAAIVLLFAGKIMAKVNLRWLLTGCFAIIGIGLFSLSFAPSITFFYIVWTIVGICQPFAILLSIPVLLGNWFQKKLATVMGIALGVSAIGGAIFNPIISGVISGFGWRAGWMAEGLIVLVLLVPTCLLIKEKPSENQVPYGYDPNNTKSVEQTIENGLTLKQAMRTPMLYLIGFALIALQFVAGFVQHISAHILNIGMPLTVGATVVSGVMLGAAVGKISIGYFLDKFNHIVVISSYTFLGMLGWAGLLLMRSSTILVASGFVLGLGQGILLVALPYLVRAQFGQKDYSNILSVLNMFGAFSSAVAVSVDGVFFDMAKSYGVPLQLNILLYILAGAAVVGSIILTKHILTKLGGPQNVD